MKILIKLSGKLITREIFSEIVSDIQQLQQQGAEIALVHGGGKTISHYLESQKIASEFIDGLRVTNDQAIKIVEMVLAGLINKQLTRWLNAANVTSVGISGSDAGLIQATQLRPELGFVGSVEKINPEIVQLFWNNGITAVIAPTGISPDHQCFNINADSSAGALAIALKVNHLIFFTDADGVLQHGQKLDSLHRNDIPELIKTGQADGGMIPKLLACQSAKESAIRQVKISGWSSRGTLLKLISSSSIGTEIT